MNNKIILILSAFLFITPVYAQESGIESLRETGKAFTSVARTVSPSVVYIRSEGVVTGQEMPDFQFPFGEGVVVTKVRPDSIAASAGIQSGSIIVQVNRIPMTSAEDFKREVKKSSASKRILLLIRKNNMQQFVALSW